MTNSCKPLVVFRTWQPLYHAAARWRPSGDQAMYGYDHPPLTAPPDMTGFSVESKNFTFPLQFNVAIRLPSGDHAAALLAA